MRKFLLFCCKAYSIRLPVPIFKLSFCLIALSFLHLFNEALAQQNVYKADKDFVKQIPKLLKAADAQYQVLRKLLPSVHFLKPSKIINWKQAMPDGGAAAFIREF